MEKHDEQYKGIFTNLGNGKGIKLKDYVDNVINFVKYINDIEIGFNEKVGEREIDFVLDFLKHLDGENPIFINMLQHITNSPGNPIELFNELHSLAEIAIMPENLKIRAITKFANNSVLTLNGFCASDGNSYITWLNKKMYPSLILQILEDEYDKYEYESISEIKNRLAELEEEICTYDNKTINEFSELHNFFEQCSDENILEIALKLLREITEGIYLLKELLCLMRVLDLVRILNSNEYSIVNVIEILKNGKFPSLLYQDLLMLKIFRNSSF